MELITLIERLEKITGKQVNVNELAIEGTIMTIISNWDYFRNEVNEWRQDTGDKYKNPFHIWKELNAEVTKEYKTKKEYPAHVMIPVETDNIDAAEAMFQLVSNNDRITYEYTGTVK